MSAIVCDASALVDYLLPTRRSGDIGALIEAPEAEVHVPALCDVEVASAFRRLLKDRAGGLTVDAVEQALADLVDLPFTRHTHEFLIGCAFELRDNLSMYDAVYVALAEALQAFLLTSDRSLAAVAERRGLTVAGP